MKKIIIPLAIAAIAAVVVFMSVSSGGGSVTVETLKAQAVAAGKPLIVQLSTEGCIICRKMKPTIQQLKDDAAGKYDVVTVDLDKNTKLAQELKINAVPVQLFISAKGELIDKHAGGLSYRDFLEDYIEQF
jgi:thioredoxin 1